MNRIRELKYQNIGEMKLFGGTKVWIPCRIIGQD